MKTHWKIYISLLSLCLPLLIQAQVNQVEKHPGYWTFGLNGGFSYQSSDIQSTDQGFGLGLTLGKSIYYQPGAPIAFDLRGRFLYARQFGLDSFRSFDIGNNSALNGDFSLDYTSYPSQLNEDRGFVFQNHRTDVADLGLEAVLTLNQLRERTGFIVSFYGGIGLDWYRTKTDQADAGGNEYFEAYSGLDENASKTNVRNELRSAILDADYESLADEFEDFGKIGFMPSLGFEIGYEISPTFSIFAGHRLTFSGTDLLDGHQWENPNKDIYHYTNFGLRWKVEPRRQILAAPEIDITRPYDSPFYTQDPKDGYIRADIKNVRSQVDVSARLNGRDIPFEYSYGTFETDFPLQPGRNEVQITARNTAGSANKSVVIFLEEKTAPPVGVDDRPSIVITNPPYPDYQTSDQNYRVQAIVEGVDSRDQVEFFLDGEARNFDFNLTNGNLSANVPLREGRNAIRIVARNKNGRQEEQSALIREAVSLAPNVSIQQPNKSYSETSANAIELIAIAAQVERKDQISVLVNGRNINNFNFNPQNGQINTRISLQQGNNTIEVIAKTEGGTDSDRVSVVLREPLPASPYPIVDIQVPAQNRVATSQAFGDVRARVQHVNSKNDVTFEVNGRRINNFSFSNGLIQASVSLREGDNEIRITVYNESGSDNDAVNILREREVIQSNPPSISISSPRDNQQSSLPNVDLAANTRNVLRKSDVAIFINGRRINNFTFNSFNGRISASLPLEPGLNNVSVQVRNNDGGDEANLRVSYRRAAPPALSIVSPQKGFRTREAQVQVQAIAQNISRTNQIAFYFNGRRMSRFNFSGARGEISADLRLQPGLNRVRILAENEDGQAEDQINITFEQLPAPVVRISQPVDKSVSEEQQLRLEASVQNVARQNDIQVNLNGRRINNFRFNSSDNRLTADISLQEGDNIVRVRAVNPTGSDEAAAEISYAPLQKPTIIITDPSSANVQSKNSNYTLRARTTHVTLGKSISIMVNGQRNTTYNWDAKSGNLNLPLTLKEGENRVAIQVRNQAGQAQANTTIVYEAPKTPEVSILQPGKDTTTVKENQVSIRARITNVNSKKNVILQINGQYRTNFTLNGENFNMELKNLQEGENRIVLGARNQHGRGTDQISVVYAPVKSKPPVVDITSVSNPVIDFNNPSYGIVTLVARIENVVNKEQISAKLDGKNVNDFSFNAKSQTFEAKLVLNKGKTYEFVIRATNESGADEKRRELSF